jgi:protein-S-isoprenylcysteine O-methyltransferase Ste14
MEDMYLIKIVFATACVLLAMAIGVAIFTWREMKRTDKANAKWKELSGE